MRKAPLPVAAAAAGAGAGTGGAEGSTGSPRRPFRAAAKPAAKTPAVARPSVAGRNQSRRRREVRVTERYSAGNANPRLTHGVQLSQVSASEVVLSAEGLAKRYGDRGSRLGRVVCSSPRRGVRVSG